MKKVILVVGILVAAAVVIFVATKGFAFKVPGSVKGATKAVTEGPQEAAYDACKVWADAHKNNLTYNSSNILDEMKGKEFTDLIYEKDWHKSESKYDKQNQRLELRATYNQFAELKVRCTKDKCASIYCNKVK